MHDAPPVSLVIVSRARPEALMRCLFGVSQLDYPNLEVIVVACPKGQAVVKARLDADHFKLEPFDEANISAARNVGISAAAGEIVAFLDDDAVPEPDWLTHLIAPFSDAGVACSGGYVVGRNGISLQWSARCVDLSGQAFDLNLKGLNPVSLQSDSTRAIKTEGTNMAVRRDVLAELHGFDPAFHFFLDETDLNIRIAGLGRATAIVPRARVHHGFAASARRRPDRVPRDLRQIGASQAVFLRKHFSRTGQAEALARFEREQRQRLLRHMQTGALTPDDVVRLMHGLRDGIEEGRMREYASHPGLARASVGFLPYPVTVQAERVTVAGWFWQRNSLKLQARHARQAGKIVRVFRFSPTTLFHRVSFTKDAVWVQKGGVFGKSERSQRFFQITTFRKRLRRETRRVAQYA